MRPAAQGGVVICSVVVCVCVGLYGRYSGLYEGLVGLYVGLVGLVGLYEGLVGLYVGLVGLYVGLVGLRVGLLLGPYEGESSGRGGVYPDLRIWVAVSNDPIIVSRSTFVLLL